MLDHSLYAGMCLVPVTGTSHDHFGANYCLGERRFINGYTLDFGFHAADCWLIIVICIRGKLSSRVD
jgi:hypothetical protein